MKTFRSNDGLEWRVAVRVPSHSSAMVTFEHPAGGTGRLDRYAWVNAHAAGAHDPRSRLAPDTVLSSLTDRDLARLFRRSMPVQTQRPAYLAS